MMDAIVKGETFTQRCRRMLTDQPAQLEFKLSRGGLETLVHDSEQYGASNEATNDLLLTCRKIASETTTMSRNAEAWLAGEWDVLLPGTLRKLAEGAITTLAHDCSNAVRP